VTLTYEQVTKRNKRHRDPRTRATDRALARASRQRGARLHREPHQEIELPDWKQPGRRFGPSPLGPDHPKLNKVTDSDGNARIMPLTADQRITRYLKASHRSAARPRDDADESDYDARRHAELLGVTLRQLRRIVHKANHAAAPFGKRMSA
jgi:hypothetical protein